MMTKQDFPLHRMKCLSSFLALSAVVKMLSPFFFFLIGFLNVSMYFDRHGDHIRCMSIPSIACEDDKEKGWALVPRSQPFVPKYTSCYASCSLCLFFSDACMIFSACSLGTSS